MGQLNLANYPALTKATRALRLRTQTCKINLSYSLLFSHCTIWPDYFLNLSIFSASISFCAGKFPLSTHGNQPIIHHGKKAVIRNGWMD